MRIISIFSMHTVFCGLLLMTFLLQSSLLSANPQNNIDLYKQRLEQLSSVSEDPKDKEQRELYQKIILAWQSALRSDKEALQSRNLLERMPSEIKKLQKDLSVPVSSVNLKKMNKGSTSELEQQLTLEKAYLLELEQSEKQVQQQVKQSNDKLISLRTELAALKQQEYAETGGDSALDDAQFSAHNARIQAIELELLTLPGLGELNQIRIQLLTRQLEYQQILIQGLQDILQDKRRSEAEKTLEQVSFEPENIENHTIITEQIILNQKLSQDLQEVIAQGEEALTQSRLLMRKLNLFKQSYTALQLQTELSREPLGLELNRFVRHLEEGIDTLSTQKKINKLRLLALDLSRSELTIESVNLNTEAHQLDDTQHKKFQSLRNDYKAISTKTREVINQTINELSDLLSIQEQFREQVSKGKDLISQHLLWVPSVLAVSTQWIPEVTTGISLVIAALPPRTELIGKGQSYLISSEHWVGKLTLWGLQVLLSAVLLLRLKRDENRWSEQIGNVVNDRFSNTLAALLLPLLIILPVPTGFYLLLNDILNSELWLISLPKLAPAVAVLCTIYLALCYWLKVPNGLFHKHLSVSATLCLRLLKLLHPTFWLGSSLLLVIFISEQSDNLIMRSGPGRAALIVAAAIISGFCISLYRSLAVESTSKIPLWLQLRPWLAFYAVNYLLIIFAAILGYTFTGQAFLFMLMILSGISVLTFVFYRFGNRWLLIEERRLAFERAKARRNEILEAREKNEEVPLLEENYLDLQTISDQARVLLRAVTGILFILLLWTFLKNALPAFAVLDNVVLWSSDITTSEGIIPQAITLKSILVSIVLIGLCILAAYSLPGLLELVVLRHLTLSPGSSYAITTITRYILIVTSIIAGTGQLGLDWSKLQWLVAALGVGLGFGLQEIVANFVSGLIILFEKPIRIGDTVTIGTYSGTVTRIQIRATTISDWDRKEIIIPNKNFVTDQLINWSLTDPITRIIISVGIAHGSDTELAKELLLKAAENSPKVLADPEPSAFFMNFGPSTLNLELRLFVSNMDDRLVVTHEINQAIDQAFKEHKITIAYQQLDINLKKNPL